MTSHMIRLVWGFSLVAVAGLVQGMPPRRDPLAPLTPEAVRARPAPVIAATPRIAPASMRDRINALGRAFDGKAGISVVSIGDGWQADYNAATLFPQQSVGSPGTELEFAL